MLNNIFYAEKFEAVSGIYIIYNVKNSTFYIGQAKDLKERMRQHITSLYKKEHFNRNLQEEFNKGNNQYIFRALLYTKIELLDLYESISYQVASEKFPSKRVHNIVDLSKKIDIAFEQEEAEKVENRIKEIINDSVGFENHHIIDDKEAMHLKDWLSKSNEEIIRASKKKLEQLKIKGGTNPNTNPDNIQLESKSIVKLLDSGKLKYLIMGKMGDYIGEKSPQSITNILIEKIADIGYKGKCLWAAEGAKISCAKCFIEKNGFANEKDEKKVFALFALTFAQYSNNGNEKESEKKVESNCVRYFWKDDSGEVYYATAPSKNKKALVIDRFWTIKENFDFQAFCDLYYKYLSGHHLSGKLNPAICAKERLSLTCTVLKDEVIENKYIREDMFMDEDLFRSFKENIFETKPVTSNDFFEFAEESDSVHYILAEVIDYVEIEKNAVYIYDKSEIDFPCEEKYIQLQIPTDKIKRNKKVHIFIDGKEIGIHPYKEISKEKIYLEKSYRESGVHDVKAIQYMDRKKVKEYVCLSGKYNVYNDVSSNG